MSGAAAEPANSDVNLQAPNPNTTDNEATNCSETMSTNEEEETNFELRRQEIARSLLLSAEQTPQPTARVQTPRRIQQQQSLNNVDILLGDSSNRAYCDDILIADDSPTEQTATLSLASGFQAPPSYGTACAILDAGQLVRQQAEPAQSYESRGLILVNNNNQGVPTVNNSGYNTSAYLRQPPAMFNYRSELRLTPQISNQTANLPSQQASASHQQQHQRSNLSSYLTSSLPRIHWLQQAHLQQQQQQQQLNFQMRQQRSQTGLNLLADSNQPQNWQQQHQLFAGPSNHVIAGAQTSQAPGFGALQFGNQQESALFEARIPRSISAAAAPNGPQTFGQQQEEQQSSNNRQRDYAPQLPPHLNQNHEPGSLMDELSVGGSNASSLLRNSRRQQQQANRKRRRHRASLAAGSNKSLSPDSTRQQHSSNELGVKTEDDQQQQQQRSLSLITAKTSDARAPRTKLGQPTRQQAISAHCWLIDTSDDQTYEPSTQGKARRGATQNLASVSASHSNLMGHQGGHGVAGRGSEKTKHLTVALMRQSMQQQQQQQRDGALTFMTLDRTVRDNRRDLTTNLRTNSLRMERATNKSSPGHLQGISARLSPLRQQNSRLSRRRSSSQSDSGQRRANHSDSSTIARLSALLTLLSNLVRKNPTRGHTRKVALAANEQLYCPTVPANSISGSLAPYTAASLAISSSSSTSAYATGSSHLSSGGSGVAQMRTLDRPIALATKRIFSNGKSQVQQQSSAASLAGSSMFYSSVSSGTNQHPAPLSWHAYEYCDDDAIQRLPQYPRSESIITETQFLGDRLVADRSDCFGPTTAAAAAKKAEAEVKMVPLDEHISLTSSTDSSSVKPTTSEHESHNQQQSLAANQNRLTSDHELISGISDSFNQNQEPSAGGFVEVMTKNLERTTAAVRRPRRGFFSLKGLLTNPCSNRLSSDSESASCVPVNQQLNRIEAAKYRSLKSVGIKSRPSYQQNVSQHIQNNCTRETVREPRQRQQTTIQNIISLAKADRVFRIRLLASIVVSCILLALICLLASVTYFRSAYNQNSRLLVDDSDYDLSWLWPQPNQQSSEASRAPLSRIMSDSMSMHRYNLSVSESNRINHDYPFDQLDGILKTRLILIEQSERLDQFQRTMTHLTNIQLANDNFLDLTELSRHLSISNQAEVPSGMSLEIEISDDLSNVTSRVNDTSQAKQLNSQVDRFAVHFGQLDYDLASLTLLSNLHWPLVKWRHQNQQSVVNFLSFSSAPASFTGSQTLRNLLSILMLIDSSKISNQSAHGGQQVNNLKHFIRLNSLLKGASYHLITCVAQISHYEQGSYFDDSMELTKGFASLKLKFCQLLLKRYRRMMLTLNQLDHAHLVKLNAGPNIDLHRSPDMLASRSHEGDAADMNLQWKSSKTLLGFFLDRLEILNVETLAEVVLANENTEMFHKHNTDFDANQLIESIISRPMYGINLGDHRDKSLIDYAKLVIGDGPLRLNVNLNLERNKQFKTNFQQIETENNELWKEQLARDLLYPWPSFKLPAFVEPLRNDLFLHPNLTTKLILGMIKIEFKILKPTKFIVINSDKLNLVDLTLWQRSQQIDQTSATSSTSQSSANATNSLHLVPLRRVLINSRLEQIHLELQDMIAPTTLLTHPSLVHPSDYHSTGSQINFGEIPSNSGIQQAENRFVINISFNKTSLMGPKSGRSNEAAGLEFVQYADYFAQPEAELKTLLYTQFEPHNARRLFPCFDEPKLKVKFQLDLVHESNHQVLFNSGKREKVPYSPDEQLQMSVFDTTPIPISTYLISFVVCDGLNFKSITSRVPQLSSILNQHNSQQQHVQVQILAQFEHLSQAEFASQLVPHLLAFYQAHFQFSFPSEKLDLIAIPKRVTATGGEKLPTPSTAIDTMENFGLIWFKAPILLLDVNLVNQNLLESISMIISHQLAHQYFGNIIGLESWQDLWLYEALCQYLESLSLINVQPDWKLEEQFLVTSIQDTLLLEQYDTSYEEYLQQQSLSAQANRPHELAADSVAIQLDRASEMTSSNDSLESNRLDLSQDFDPYNFQFVDLQQTITTSGLFPGRERKRQTDELKKSSAVIHMLMLNLLPSIESQARLLKRCLNNYSYKTMNQMEFWQLFGEQVKIEGQQERIGQEWPPAEAAKSTVPTNKSYNGATENESLFAGGNFSSSLDDLKPSERVVFVKRKSKVNAKQSFKNEDYFNAELNRTRLRPSRSSNNRLVDNLDLVANVWLDNYGYPLILASAHRDRIYLKQERFTLAWWRDELNAELGGHLDQPTSMESHHLLSDQPTKRSIDGGDNDDDDDVNNDTIWPIPLMFVSKFNPKLAGFFWMNKRELELPFVDNSLSQDHVYYHHNDPFQQGKRQSQSIGWFKLNVNQSSLVRVNYDDKNWELLTDLLLKSHYSNHVLNPLDRANLLDDSLTLMRCGKLSVSIAMNLTLYLEVGERDYMPWTVALRHLDSMQTLLNQNPLWHRYVLRIMSPISSIIGWKDDGPHLMRKLRRLLFNVALQYGDDKIIQKAKLEFKNWFKSGRFIVPNLQELVYVAGVRYGDQQEWFHCWQKYQQLISNDQLSSSLRADSSNNIVNQTTSEINIHNSILKNIEAHKSASMTNNQVVSGLDANSEPNAENEKRQLLTALASTHNTWLLEQFLNYSLDSSKIQPNHLKHLMQTLGKNPVARLYLWRFVRLNWANLIERYNKQQQSDLEGEYQIVETMIVESTKHFASKLDLDEVRTFFEAKRNLQQQWSSTIEKAIQQSIQIIKSNIYWRDYIEPKLTKWLSHYDSSILK